MLEYFQNIDRGEVKKKNQMNDCILHQFLPTIVTHSISLISSCLSISASKFRIYP